MTQLESTRRSRKNGRFRRAGDTHTRQYPIKAEVALRLLTQSTANDFDFDPPDWFQL